MTLRATVTVRKSSTRWKTSSPVVQFVKILWLWNVLIVLIQFTASEHRKTSGVQKFSDFIIFQGLVLTSSYLGKLRLVVLVMFLQVRFLTEAPYQLCFTRPGSLASPWLRQQVCPGAHGLPSGSVLHREIQR